MKKPFYFHHDSDSEENYFSEIHFQKYMKEFDMTEITVFKAKRMYGQDFFYCSKFQDIGEKGESCGSECSAYKPRNGKSGICIYNKPVYEPGEKVILKLKTTSRKA